MNNTRELINSPIRQSIREKRARGVQLVAGLNATAPAVKVFDESDDSDISAVAGVLTGVAAIDSDVFTTPAIAVPTAGKGYRVECWFTANGEQYIRYFRILAET